MAHYALLDENNIVTQVITGVDETELIDGESPEVWYGNFHNQVCKRTSYNTFGNTHNANGVPFRGNYAGIGYYYDGDFDAFIAPRPYPSWKLNYETFTWEAPIPKPADIEEHWWRWSEVNQEWVSIKVS